MKQPSEMRCLKTTSIYKLQADFSWLYSVLLTSTHLSIKRSSLFKLNKFSRMVSIYKMNKYKLCTADFSNQLKKTVFKLCFENLQNKQYHHSYSEDDKKVLRRLHHNLLQGLLIYLSNGWISSALKTPKITVSNFGTLSCKHNKRIPLPVCSLKEKHTAPILKPQCTTPMGNYWKNIPTLWMLLS